MLDTIWSGFNYISSEVPDVSLGSASRSICFLTPMHTYSEGSFQTITMQVNAWKCILDHPNHNLVTI